MAGTPEIYKHDAATEPLPNVSNAVKESTKELKNYQSILSDLEKNVILNQKEIEKQKVRNLAYALNVNRGAKQDYTNLANSLKDKTGYSAPKNNEEKVLYDITFRLKELGFAKNIDLSQKVDYNDKLAREIIAFQKLAQLKGQEGVVGPETLKALLDGKASATTVLEQTKNAVIPAVDIQGPQKIIIQTPENIEDKPVPINLDHAKKFNVAATLSNTNDNISKEEFKIFQKLDNKVNKGDVLYSEFEKSLITNVDKILAGDKVKTLTDNNEVASTLVTHQNVSELLRNYSEGYLEEDSEEVKDIELDPNFFFALRDTIVQFLSDTKKTADQKQWLILFVRSFTDNFNDIIQSYQDSISKAALSMIAPQLLQQ